jgi:hypothetical protein
MSADRHDARLFRMEGELTELVTVGLLPEGVRMHNTFEGTIVAGEPSDARVRGAPARRRSPSSGARRSCTWAGSTWPPASS